MKYLAYILFGLMILLPRLLRSQTGSWANPTFENLPPEQYHSVAPNVAIGNHSLIACYPDQVEVIMYWQESRIAVITFDEVGLDNLVMYDAAMSQYNEYIYRADINRDTWIEINAATGITIIHQHCVSRVFTPQTYAAR
jgi:hypothetical protein